MILSWFAVVCSENNERLRISLKESVEMCEVTSYLAPRGCGPGVLGVEKSGSPHPQVMSTTTWKTWNIYRGWPGIRLGCASFLAT